MTKENPTKGIRDGTITVVSGPRGRGKSYLLKAMLKGKGISFGGVKFTGADLTRVLIIDTLSEYDYPVLEGLNEVLAWIDRGAPDARRYRVSVRVGQAEVDYVLRAAWDLYPVTILIEETDLYCTGAGKLDPGSGLSALVEYGRRFGLSIIAVTRRPAHVSRTITANARYAFIFGTIEPRDLQYWKAYLPGEAYGALEGLTGHEYVIVDLWSGTCEVRTAP